MVISKENQSLTPHQSSSHSVSISQAVSQSLSQSVLVQQLLQRPLRNTLHLTPFSYADEQKTEKRTRKKDAKNFSVKSPSRGSSPVPHTVEGTSTNSTSSPFYLPLLTSAKIPRPKRAREESSASGASEQTGRLMQTPEPLSAKLDPGRVWCCSVFKRYGTGAHAHTDLHAHAHTHMRAHIKLIEWVNSARKFKHIYENEAQIEEIRKLILQCV